VAAGLYTETLSIDWSLSYCDALGWAGLWRGLRDIKSGVASIADISVTKDFQISE